MRGTLVDDRGRQGPTRANLISKGLVFAPDHGVIAYPVPAMAAFVGRQPKQT
jgi:hypothetical protein